MDETTRTFLISNREVIEIIDELDALLGQVCFNIGVTDAVVHELCERSLMFEKPNGDYLYFGEPIVEHLLKAAISGDDGNAAGVRQALLQNVEIFRG